MMRGHVVVSFQVTGTGGYGTAGVGSNSVLDRAQGQYGTGPQGINANGDSTGFSNSNSIYNIDSKWANLIIPVHTTPQPTINRPSSSGVSAPDYRAQMQDYRSAPTNILQTDHYSSLIRKYYGMTTSERKKLQQDLYEAGYYQGQGKPTIDGTVRDTGFIQGYEMSLQHAYMQQTPWAELIDNNKATIKAEGGIDSQTGQQRAPLQIVTTSPDDLRSAAITAGQSLTGENPDDTFINNFIASYHSAEITAQQQKYDTALTGGSLVAPPSQSSAAEAALRQQQPEKVRGHAEAGGVDTLRQLIQSSAANV